MLCSIYNVCRQTVSTWYSKWEKLGICGLIDEPGRGRSSLLTDSQKVTVVQKVETLPRSLRAVLSEIEMKFDIILSIDTLKLIRKQAGLVWKRVRKSLRKKRNQEDFDASKEEIEQLIQQHSQTTISFFSSKLVLNAFLVPCQRLPSK